MYWTMSCRLTRVPLSGLFCIIVGLSLLLTLLVLNETSRVHGLWRRMAVVGKRYDNEFESVKIDLSSSESVHEFKPRLSQINALAKKYRAKLKLFRSSFGSERERHQNKGWKLLPGSVVVHDGQAENPHDFKYILNPSDVCDGLEKNRISVLVFIESDVKNGIRRKAIRDTWALPMMQRALNFRIVFLLGMSKVRPDRDVEVEFYSYGDVVQENFTETFEHLGLKSVMGLKWARDRCPQATFVVKTDDDILLHMPNLLEVLSRYEDVSKLLLCHKNRSRQIVRSGTSLLKYRVSPYQLPGIYFPSYCSGFAYVMSRDTVTALFEASLKTPYFFIEDVYVTGFCRHKAGIEALDHPSLVLQPHVTAEQAPCSFTEGRITSQELDHEEMRDVWRTLNTKNFFCPVPVST